MLCTTNLPKVAARLSRIVVLACVAAGTLAAVDCAAQDPQPLTGRLYMSVFKRVPPESLRKARQIVAVDLATGRYEEVGAPGIDPRVSPDGKQIAYWTLGSRNESYQAWIKELGRNDEPRFLSYGQISGWLNDGAELIVKDPQRQEKGHRWLYSNYFIDASGANRRDLKLPPQAYVVDCTADGKWLLICGIERGQLHLLAADGGEPTRVSLPVHQTYKGRFSPDGRQVTYVASAKPNRVVILNRDGSNWREIYRGKGLTDPKEVCSSPDGKHLAIVLFDWIEENGRRIRSVAPEHDNNFRVLIVDKEGKNPRPLLLEGLAVTEIIGLDWK
jgi:Tol biopolymer transport system component